MSNLTSDPLLRNLREVESIKDPAYAGFSNVARNALAEIERLRREPAEHPPELMAVVDEWQDRTNLMTNQDEAELVRQVLRDIRRATYARKGELAASAPDVTKDQKPRPSVQSSDVHSK